MQSTWWTAYIRVGEEVIWNGCLHADHRNAGVYRYQMVP